MREVSYIIKPIKDAEDMRCIGPYQSAFYGSIEVSDTASDIEVGMAIKTHFMETTNTTWSETKVVK